MLGAILAFTHILWNYISTQGFNSHLKVSITQNLHHNVVFDILHYNHCHCSSIYLRYRYLTW